MPGRIRTVKPEWLEDELIAMASSDARVLSVSLLLLADDYGNGRSRIRLLCGQVFPNGTDTQTKAALDELVQMGFVELYEASGQQYFHIRNWGKHQKVNRPGKPRVPAPDSDGAKSLTPETATDSDASKDSGNPPNSSRHPGGNSCKSPATLSADHDHIPHTNIPPTNDHNLGIGGGGGGPGGKVPCPPDLKLSEATLASLEIDRTVPRWASEEILARFALASSQDAGDLRAIATWRKCAVKAICGDWGDPKRRPSKPETSGAERRKAHIAAKERQLQREARERKLADERLGIDRSSGVSDG